MSNSKEHDQETTLGTAIEDCEALRFMRQLKSRPLYVELSESSKLCLHQYLYWSNFFSIHTKLCKTYSTAVAILHYISFPSLKFLMTLIFRPTIVMDYISLLLPLTTSAWLTFYDHYFNNNVIFPSLNIHLLHKLLIYN